MKISIQKNNVKYNVQNQTFSVSGHEVTQFGTTHELYNENTEKSVTFNFKESTGSEWDNDTKWIYESENGLFKLEVGNEDVTLNDQLNYQRAKGY